MGRKRTSTMNDEDFALAEVGLHPRLSRASTPTDFPSDEETLPISDFEGSPPTSSKGIRRASKRRKVAKGTKHVRFRKVRFVSPAEVISYPSSTLTSLTTDDALEIERILDALENSVSSH